MNLTEAIEANLVAVQDHPILPLQVFNYTSRAQYDRVWNATTLSHRGLVKTLDGEIVSHCLPKFFNLQEHRECDWLPDVPVAPFDVYEKLDGSYISVSNFDGHRVVASRGSFTSPHVAWAEDLLGDWIPDSGLTYIFELIHPQNRIVVDYGDRAELVLLTIFHRSGREIDRDEWPEQFTHSRAFDGESGIDALLQHSASATEMEGFVVRFRDSGMRVKVKTAEYVELHRILSHMSPKMIAQALQDNTFDDLIALVPDEYYGWVNTVRNDIESRLRAFLSECSYKFAKLPSDADRKTFAIAAIQTTEGPYRAAMFQILDGQDIESLAWKTVIESLDSRALVGAAGWPSFTSPPRRSLPLHANRALAAGGFQ